MASQGTSAVARVIDVSLGGDVGTVSQAIERAQAGDTVRVHGGVYAEHIVVDKPIAIIGVGMPVIDGGGKGTVVSITAPGASIKGFVIRGSGSSLTFEDSAVSIEGAPDCTVEGNRLEDVLFGIYLKNSPRSVIRNNVVFGKDLPVPQRGDAIRLWYTADVLLENNLIERTRDLVIWYSRGTMVRGNRVKDARYGLHFMYSDDNVFEGNVFEDSYVGSFLMYSSGLRFHYNTFVNNRGLASGYGVGFKDVDDVTATENLIVGNRIGLYIDNSPRSIESWNLIEGNVIAYNDIGVSFMPAVERNKVFLNSFIDNREQVQVRGGGTLSGNVWFEGGRGNHWSDYVGYDEDGDGVGEIPYLAESLFESLVDRYPNFELFVYSPATQAIDYASKAFPALAPEPKVKDDFPLIRPKIPQRFISEESRRSHRLFLASLGMVVLSLCVYLYLVLPPFEWRAR